MLNLENVLWVIPGVIFTYFYNRRRPSNIIKLSGWPYLFFIVVIAFFTWLPTKWILFKYFGENPFFSNDPLLQEIFTTLISIIFSIFLFLITQVKFILHFISAPVNDNFYNKCVKWENNFVFLNLKNGKTYIGILWKYPESPKSRHESQTISMVPFKSGYRTEQTKEVIWTTDYPKYENHSDFVDMEVIIPRTEIVTFGKFSSKTFKYFEKQKIQK